MDSRDAIAESSATEGEGLEAMDSFPLLDFLGYGRACALNERDYKDLAILSVSKQVAFNRGLAVLASHQKLERKMDTIKQMVASSATDVPKLKAVVEETQQDMKRVHHFLESFVDSFPTEMRLPTAKSALKAKEVLATPELLEAILLHLTPYHMLAAKQLNRAASQIFADSLKLQDALQLRTHQRGFFSEIFNHGSFPQISVGVDRAFRRLSGAPFDVLPIEGYLITDTLMRKLPSIGSACRQMLICNPPIHSMRVSVGCCTPRHNCFDSYYSLEQQLLTAKWGWESRPSSGVPASAVVSHPNGEPSYDARATGKGKVEGEDEEENSLNAKVGESFRIECAKGITVGHLHDATQMLRDEHENCPHASVGAHDLDGIVRPTVAFYGCIKLNKDDPYLHAQDDELVRSHLYNRSRGDLRDLRPKQVLPIFVAAKKRAFNYGWPLLTFDEVTTKHDIHFTTPGDLDDEEDEDGHDWPEDGGFCSSSW